MGRFLTVDPLLQLNGHPVSLNPYAYARHNPTSFTDIGGLYYEFAWFDSDESIGGDGGGCADSGSCFDDFETDTGASAGYQLPDGVETGGSQRVPPCCDAYVTVVAPYPSTGLSSGQQAALNIAITVALSSLPGGGEAMDLATIFSPESTPLDRGLAGVSLAANIFFPLLPNFSTISKLAREGELLLDAERAASVVPKAAREAWRAGDDIYAATRNGAPAWSTVRARFWKNEAANAGAVERYGAENVERMRRGAAPQRFNPDKGAVESMELSHEPIPARVGGRELVPRWPQDHAAVDPYRRPGY